MGTNFMEWTTEPITERGYYWLQLKDDFWERELISEAVICTDFESEGFKTYISGYRNNPFVPVNLENFTRWSGPIPKPQEPNFMKNKDLNELAAEVHQANIKWWQNMETGEPIERNKFELLALIVSEISECLEGERKNSMDDKLPRRRMAEVELADAKIRILDYAAGFGFRLPKTKWPHVLVPHNKGEALFLIIECVMLVSQDRPECYLSMALTRIEDYAEHWDYDIDSAFAEKMAYNATREDHTHEARKIAGGKQF